MHKEGIAIIGTGCRFPGGVHNLETFWQLLAEGREAVSEIPADRWNIDRYYDEEPGTPGKSMAKRGGFVDGIEQYDPQFFGISPREAPYIDPQQRLLLETAWEALEDAGLILDFEHGTDIGVFVGISHTDYQIIQGTPWDSAGISPHSPTGSAHSIAANRISYCLNLLGPSVAMDTACSSALTAVHNACEHIWNGRGDTALAGGVTVMITPGGFIGFSQASMLSPEGRCAAFDASASGFVRGEGAGMVVLKSLSKAIVDGDPIQGVILGTSLNQDGHTNGIMLPSPEAQARLVVDACKDAGVAPASISFVEAHGTGTAVGDPIEANALAMALCLDRADDNILPIGSVKTNLGHLETAAGIAGLLKALLVLKRGEIPPSLHFKNPNPNIDFEGLKLRVPTELESLPQTGEPRRAGVNSFGFGGANAHVIMQEPPVAPHHKLGAELKERPWPITISARSENALKATAERLAQWLDEHSRNNGSSPMLPDLVYTLGARRNHHQHRLTLVAASMEELIRELEDFAHGEASQKVRASFTPRPETPPRIAFIMSGQGPQWWGMGRELMASEPVFRATMERCEAAMKPYARFSLLEELAKTKEDSQMSRTEIAQPAIFAMQVSLAELWESWGVEPAAIVGHSVGEIAAACVAGVLSLEEAARVIVMRGRFMEGCARGAGAMLAVGLDEAEAKALIARHDRTVSIAAFNGPKSLTLAGVRLSLEAMHAELEAAGVFARFVKVDHPFHHAMMQPASEELETALASLKPQPETVPIFSTVSGGRCAGPDFDAEHWGRGVRQPVEFVSAVNAIAEFGVDVWLELSAHPALAVSMLECLAALGMKAPVVSSTRREREHEASLEAALELHRAGVTLNFAGMTPSRHQLTLPSYAWDKARWWSESSEWKESRLAPGGKGLLDIRLPRAIPTWNARLDNRHMAFLKDHKVDNFIIFPAAGFVDLILEAGVQLFEGRPFVVEDFEIRKPLILPDPVSGLVLEVSYDPTERTFTIQSRFEQRAVWSVHVVGSMRAERTESPFSGTHWERPSPNSALAEIEVGGFYQHMSDLGLRYGEEFRPIRELWAGGGHSAGKVTLGENIASRAGAYPLHPVLLDGALQTFSAGAATVEDRKARMKLPVRFGRILFLGSPGAETLVRANVRDFNDEFITGDIGLYDKTGKPCVLVDGFHAISMANVRRSAPGGTHDLVYHLEWERTAREGAPAPLAPLPLKQLRVAAETALGNVLSARTPAKLLEEMSAEDDLAAALIARGFREMGATTAKAISAKSLGVAPGMEVIFGRLAEGLVRHGLLKKLATGYKLTPAFGKAADSTQEMLRDFIGKHAGHLPEALICANTCGELPAILRGEKDAVAVLFSGSGADLLDQFYGDSMHASHWLAAIAGAVQEAARALPEGRGLRILEVGAGTAGLAAHLLPLLQRGLHTYTFTDVSAAFFSAANQKLAAFPEVEYHVLDLEKPVAKQDFVFGAYDIVIGTNVIHAVADVGVALRNIHDLLAPGGTLFFMEVATPRLWTESVFGLMPGWWHFTDRELRTEGPLLQRPQWEAVMQKAGFGETTSIPGLQGDMGEGQVGLLGRKTWDGTIHLTEQDIPVLDFQEKNWLILSDKGEIGRGLKTRLAPHVENIHLAYPEVATQKGLKTLLEGLKSNPPERIVYLWSLEPSVTKDPVLMGTDALLHLAHALEEVLPGAKIRLDLVTRGAQPAGDHSAELNLTQAPSIGIFRVILNEYANLSGRGIDLPAEPSGVDGHLLFRELLRSEPDREVAFRGEARYVQRITRGLPAPETWLEATVPLRLESRERGLLDSLKLSPFTLPAPGPGEVLIQVKAAGMNFRDVLKALALYPAETPDARIFGDEVGGVVLATGKDVKHVKRGDQVFGLAVFGLATHAIARGGDVCKIPGGLTFEEAATIPVVFMTAWHAIYNVARMRAGETILVHAGAGGVGMAAIQIAHYLGVDVIASAGSPAKRALLTTLGVKHVIDSRRGDFAEAVMELTGRKGVDCVLNALAGEAIPMGLSCLAEFGRFIEIGKRDIYMNSRIPLFHLRKNASFHVVAMDAVFNGDEALTRKMLSEIAELVEKGALGPLPYRTFPACRVDAAFRLMASGKHTGKVLVGFPETLVPRHAEAPTPGFTVSAEGNYLITGGLGGFGQVIARWLVESGARHLTLTSRSGAATEETQAFVKELQELGVNVAVIKADIGEAKDVKRVLAQAHTKDVPLRGIFHLAMVIDDRPLAELTPARFASVLGPKANGAWLLHEGTLKMPIEAFVMFSSVSSIFGNPAQGNYAAANAFLDALANHRQALGLPALTINWGVLGGQGYVARNERVAEFLQRQGTSAITAGEVIGLMESFLNAGSAQVAAIRVDWSKWRQSFRGLQQNPLLERIFASDSAAEQSESGGSDWKLRIESATPEERPAVIGAAVKDIVAGVLRVKPETLRDDQPLTDLGLDSLMGVEIENSIEIDIGVSLPPTSLLRARTIGQITARIVEHLGGAPAVAAAPVASVTAAAPEPALDLDSTLDALSDADIGNLLGEPATK